MQEERGRPLPVAPFCMDMNLVRLQLSLTAWTAEALLPLVSGQGSSFESALLRTCCRGSWSDCAECLQRDDCQAYMLLARTLSPDPDLVKRHQKPGLPYLFSLPAASAPSVCLTLLGPSIDALALFINTLSILTGGNVRSHVYAFDHQAQLLQLQFQADGQCSNLPLLSLAELYEQQRSQFVGCRSVEVIFQTPLRLRHHGRELQHLQPVVLIRGLLRRLSSLSAYYGTAGNTDYFSSLAARADQVRSVEHHPAEVHQRGICGRYRLQGPFEEFGPYLALGSLLNLGKGAAYGMGRFTVEPIE